MVSIRDIDGNTARVESYRTASRSNNVQLKRVVDNYDDYHGEKYTKIIPSTLMM